VTGKRRTGEDQRESLLSVRDVGNDAIDPSVDSSNEGLLHQANARIIEYPHAMMLVWRYDVDCVLLSQVFRNEHRPLRPLPIRSSPTGWQTKSVQPAPAGLRTLQAEICDKKITPTEIPGVHSVVCCLVCFYQPRFCPDRLPDFDQSGDSMSFIKVIVVAPILLALGACAPSPFVGSKSELAATDQRAAADINRSASILRNTHVATQATEPHAIKTPGPSFGVASFYDDEGTLTANGETFNPNELTAAHRTLPFGTRLRVTNVANGRSVVVRINDRGPFVPGRVVDVSLSAAEKLGMTDPGTAKVKLDIVH